MNINPNLRSGQRPCKHQKDTQWTRNEKRETKHECKRYTNSSFRVPSHPDAGISDGRPSASSSMCTQRLGDALTSQGDEMANLNILGFGAESVKCRTEKLYSSLFRADGCVCVCASKWLHEKGKLFVVWADCRYRVKVDAVGGFWAFVTFHRINKSNYGKWKTIRSVHLFYSVFSLRHTYHKHILSLSSWGNLCEWMWVSVCVRHLIHLLPSCFLSLFIFSSDFIYLFFCSRSLVCLSLFVGGLFHSHRFAVSALCPFVWRFIRCVCV